MMDALDILKLTQMQDMLKHTSRSNASRSAAPPPAAVTASTNVFGGAKSNPTLKPGLPNDLFQKSTPPASGPVPKGGKMVETKPFLEKSAPSGVLNGLFQTLKSKWLPPVSPAHVQQPTQALQEAAKKANPAGQAANPFKTMEAILLGKAENMAGLQNPALRTQSLHGTKPEINPKPITGLTAIALPLAGVGLLAAPLLGPTALVLKPGLLNPLVNQLPVLIP